MTALYVVICLVSVAALVFAVARPADERSRRRAAARRRRYVARHPIYVNSHDILCALVNGGVEPDQARMVTDKAAALGIPPYTSWLWLQRFDPTSLAIVVAADLSHERVLMHYATGQLPDLRELRVFAECNGLRPVDAASSRPRRILVDSTLPARRRSRPPVFEPGSWPSPSGVVGDVVAVHPTTSRRRGRRGLAA